jgi:uncharacterized protein
METVALITFKIIILGVMLFGLAGLFTTFIPGLIIIWLAALAYGLVTGFSWGNGILFGVITQLMVGGGLIDNVMMGVNSRESGASWLATGVAVVAGLIGAILWPPFGGVVAPLLGIFVGEFIRLRSWRPALNSTRNLAVGIGWSALIRIAAGAIMVILWGVWALWL